MTRVLVRPEDNGSCMGDNETPITSAAKMIVSAQQLSLQAFKSSSIRTNTAHFSSKGALLWEI